MSATPLVRRPLATALAAVLLTLGTVGAVWASSAADAGVHSPQSSHPSSQHGR